MTLVFETDVDVLLEYTDEQWTKLLDTLHQHACELELPRKLIRVASRRELILADLMKGEKVIMVAKKYNLDKSLISRIKNGKR